MAAPVERLNDISHNALMELVSFLQPFFMMRKEIERLQGGGGKELGPKHYFLPIAPADSPADLIASDPLSPAFIAPWGNIAARPPAYWRTVGPDIEVAMGGITGGESLTNSPIADLPSSVTVADNTPQFAGIGSNGIGIVMVQADLQIVYLGQVT